MDRRHFLSALTFGTIAMQLSGFKKITDELSTTDKMPAFFIGHGNPMNALYDNPFTQTLTRVGVALPKPRAALVISAHWLTSGTRVSVAPNPETIYDFGGFPPELSQVKYPAKGDPTAAEFVKSHITKTQVQTDAHMGLDHGAWTILKHLWPDAGIPVFQLSIDYTKSPQWHYELAQELNALRRKGILIIGSGNIVHNLGRLDFQNPNPATMDWALEFDTAVKTRIDNRKHSELISYENLGKAARLSVPTNDHYLPLLYTLGLQEKEEAATHIYEGFDLGSISMRCVKLG